MANKQNWFGFGGGALAVILLIVLLQTCESKKQKEQEIGSLQQTLKLYRDKDSLSTATIRVISGKVDNLEILRANGDSIAQQLIDMTKQISNLKSALISEVRTNFTKVTPTTVTNYTTVNNGDSTSYPIYSSSYQDTFIRYSVYAAKDFVNVDVSVENKFKVVQEWKRDKWYKPKYLYVTWKNENPYTTSTNLKQYEAKLFNRPKHFGVGFFAGTGIGYDYVHKRIAPTVGFGVSINYNLFTF